MKSARNAVQIAARQGIGTILFICGLIGLQIPGGRLAAAPQETSYGAGASASIQPRTPAGTGYLLDDYYINASRFPTVVSKVFVRSESNIFILGLNEQNFSVYEDGVLQQPIVVEQLGGTAERLTVVLALDRSGSIAEELGEVKRAASIFVGLLNTNSEAALVSFGTTVTVDQDFTNDKTLLNNAFNAISSAGRTALYDAVLTSVDLLRNKSGKRAIILLSDGRDRSSVNTLAEVLQQLPGAGIPVYSIGLGILPGEGEAELMAIADSSGGQYYESPTANELEEIYRTLFATLDNFGGYQITYTTNNCTKDGTTRRVEIVAANQGLSGSDSSQYVAPGQIATLVPRVSEPPSPGGRFQVHIEVPAGSPAVFSLAQLNFTLQYDPKWLRLESPAVQQILPGVLLGDPATLSFAAAPDTVAGVIRFEIKKLANGGRVSGQGVLATVGFRGAFDLADSTELVFQIADVRSDDGDGCPVALVPADLRTRSQGLIVWPGDTNVNGEVELADVLSLGVYWGMSGPPRKSAADPLLWAPQLAGSFPVRRATHSDADGNGQVSERDIIPIGINWGKKRSDVLPTRQAAKISGAAPDGRLQPVMRQAGRPNEYRMFLNYQPQNTTALAGVAFRMRFPAQKLQIRAVDIGDGWLDTPLVFSKVIASEQILAVGMIVPAGRTPMPGAGDVIEVLFETGSAPPILDDLQFEAVGLVSESGQVQEVSIITGLADGSGQPASDFALLPAYPNPFNPSTRLDYTLPAPAQVELRIYNAAGRLVTRFDFGAVAAGRHGIVWDGRTADGARVVSGVYWARLRARTREGDDYAATQKLMYLK